MNKLSVIALSLASVSASFYAHAQNVQQPAQQMRQPVALNAPQETPAPNTRVWNPNAQTQPTQQPAQQAPQSPRQQLSVVRGDGNQPVAMNPNPGIPEIPVGEPIDISKLADENAKKNVLPLSPEEIRDFRKYTEEIKRAKGASAVDMPESVATSVTVSFAPGEQQHVIRLAKDMITTLTFSDATGQAWPVLSTIAGGQSLVEIHEMGKGVRTNMVPISLKREYISTNLAVYLEGASSPIVFTIVDAQKKVDSVVKVNVRARGPMAAEVGPIDSIAGKALKKELLSAMDGITPEGFYELKVVGMEETRVWLKEKQMIVRSRGKLLSPVSMKVFPSSDGTTVYETQEASSLVFSVDGKIRTAVVSGFRNNLIARDK